MCLKGARQNKNAAYAHMKDVFLGKTLPSNSKEAAALAASRSSNVHDRRIYDAAVSMHCAHLEAHPHLLELVWVRQQLQTTRVCTHL